MPASHNTSPLMKSWELPWFYPLKGIYYFLRRPSFYPLFKARLIPIALLSAFILANLFIFTYLPQVAFLAIFHGAAAWLNATILVLGEGAAIVALLFEAFFVDETLVDVFDAVLVNQGFVDLIEEARIIDYTQDDAVKKLGKPTISSVYSPFSFRQIVEFIILLPLNLIPYAGVPVFLILTGYRAGPLHHWRYFKLLGFNKKERNAYIRQRRLKYTFFGTIALVLQLIPLLSMFFLLTTATGSALWVVKMEKARRGRENIQSIEQQYHDEIE